jgi:protein PET100, fungi type
MYIMFPIGIMYYFGTNLDSKFSVPGFWPSREQSHKIPTEKQDLDAELERLKARRLALRRLRLEKGQIEGSESTTGQPTAPSSTLSSRREG